MSREILVQGTLAKFQSLVDGTVRIIVDTHTPSEAMALLQAGVGQAVVVAPLTEHLQEVRDIDAKETRPEAVRQAPVPDNKGLYSKHANALFKHGFFHNPAVYTAAGTAEQYASWIKTQPCVVHGAKGCPAENYEDGQLFVDPTHVPVTDFEHGIESRAMAIKKRYAIVSMCHTLHAKQHQDGHCAVADDDQWALWAAEQRCQWAAETIKAQIGCEHWFDISPDELIHWCMRHGVPVALLPKLYRDAA